jgi:hypothetical protein
MEDNERGSVYSPGSNLPEVLGSPHLMLANAGRDDGVVLDGFCQF